MARPKGIKQKLNPVKYWLPTGIILSSNNPERYTKETKVEFIDPEFGVFISTYKALQEANDSTHPKSVQKRREATCIAKFGGPNPHSNPEVVKKAQNTMFEKYGTKHALQNAEFYAKAKATLQANYGVSHPMQSNIVKNQLKTSIQNIYGVNNVMQVAEIKEKVQTTVQLKYGVSNVMFDGKIQEKQKAAILSTYNKSDYLNILPNGKYVTEYCLEQETKPSTQYANKLFKLIGPELTQQWIEEHKDNRSALEIKFEDWFKELEPQKCNYKIHDNFDYRPDFFINKNNKLLYIDIDGLVYHSEKYKTENNYHLKKNQTYKKEKLTLLQFRQDELLFKPEIVKSIIKIKLGLASTKFFARKLEIKEVSTDDMVTFFNENHLMGASRSAKAIGLYNKNSTLVMCIAYRKFKNGVDLVRVASKKDTSIVGGLSRLLKAIKELELPDFIQSFVDLRYGDGHSLLEIGFAHISTSLGWAWTDGQQTFNRLQCKTNMDHRKLSEREYAEELGWFKIYDAGQAKFILNYKS